MKKYIAELTGTFALVFFGTGAIVLNQKTGGMITHVGEAVILGLIVLTMIYTFGEVSGAHFNPAVTIAFAIAGRFKREEVLPYLLSQFTGAFLATALLRALYGDMLWVTLPAGSGFQSFVLETALTFILMLVILNVSTGAMEKGGTAAVAVAAVICLEAMFAGPVSGAFTNPFRSFNPALVSGSVQMLGIYLIAPFIGSIWAVITHKFLYWD